MIVLSYRGRLSWRQSQVTETSSSCVVRIRNCLHIAVYLTADEDAIIARQGPALFFGGVGAGIGALPDFMARTDRNLVPVARKQKLTMRDIWLVVHSDLKGAAPIRAVSRWIQDVFAPAGKPGR